MWEYNAPQYVDFTKRMDDDRADAYFGMFGFSSERVSLKSPTPPTVGCGALVHSFQTPDTQLTEKDKGTLVDGRPVA